MELIVPLKERKRGCKEWRSPVIGKAEASGLDSLYGDLLNEAPRPQAGLPGKAISFYIVPLDPA